MDLYIHSPIRLHGEVLIIQHRDNFTFYLNHLESEAHKRVVMNSTVFCYITASSELYVNLRRFWYPEIRTSSISRVLQSSILT
jgi:hypothetical protein